MQDNQNGIKVVDQLLLLKNLNATGTALVAQGVDSDESILYSDASGNLRYKNSNADVPLQTSLSPIVVVNTSMTLLPEHSGKVFIMDNESAAVITWNDDDHPLPIGFNCTVIKNTSESVSFALVGDISLNSTDDNVTIEHLCGAVTFVIVSSTLGFLFGDLYTP